MAILEPQYVPNYVAYRYPNAFEFNGLSDYNFLYTPVSKPFLFKSENDKVAQQITIDLLVLDNLIEVNDNGQRA